jgi:hypothetical protein
MGLHGLFLSTLLSFTYNYGNPKDICRHMVTYVLSHFWSKIGYKKLQYSDYEMNK